MKAKRVDCIDCLNFIMDEFEKFGNKESYKVVSRAKCKLGKRVMFRMPIFLNQFSYNPVYEGGYIRYCNEFEKLNP